MEDCAQHYRVQGAATHNGGHAEELCDLIARPVIHLLPHSIPCLYTPLKEVFEYLIARSLGNSQASFVQRAEQVGMVPLTARGFLTQTSRSKASASARLSGKVPSLDVSYFLTHIQFSLRELFITLCEIEQRSCLYALANGSTGALRNAGNKVSYQV